MRNAIAGAALAWALIAAPAAAQTVDPAAETSGASQEQGDDNAGQAPAAEDIIVTGSRIPRSATDTIAPVQILSSRDLDRRAFSTLGDALNEQPQFGVPGSSPVGGGQSDLGPGQSFVNFLGLGSQRTLVLVNGRRFVSSNTSSIFGPTGSGGTQVDLNVIPTKLIDRVETVAAIGAPIYGSDAIAGTINVRLKRNFEGISLDGTAGISEEGDAGNYRVRALTNFATNPFCALVTRDAQRQISSVTTSYFNSTVLRYRGIIGNLDYRIDTPFLGAGTRVGINVSYQHLLELSNLTGGAAAPRIVATSLGYSRDRAVATVSYDGGPLALQAQFNYIGPANLDPNAAANFYSIPRVGSVVFTNLSASLTVDRRFTFRANVDNLFDVNPPYPALLAGGGLQPYFSGVLGRYYRIGVEVGF